MCRACKKLRDFAYCGEYGSAERAYINLRQRLREQKLEEATLWTRQHVADLIAARPLTPVLRQAIKLGMPLRHRVERVDVTKPFLPDNARIVSVGDGRTAKRVRRSLACETDEYWERFCRS